MSVEPLAELLQEYGMNAVAAVAILGVFLMARFLMKEIRGMHEEMMAVATEFSTVVRGVSDQLEIIGVINETTQAARRAGDELMALHQNPRSLFSTQIVDERTLTILDQMSLLSSDVKILLERTKT